MNVFEYLQVETAEICIFGDKEMFVQVASTTYYSVTDRHTQLRGPLFQPFNVLLVP